MKKVVLVVIMGVANTGALRSTLVPADSVKLVHDHAQKNVPRRIRSGDRYPAKDRDVGLAAGADARHELASASIDTSNDGNYFWQGINPLSCPDGCDYKIRVGCNDTESARTGPSSCLDSDAPPPTNDTCQTAISIGTGTFVASTGGAGTDDNASCGDGGEADVWWHFTALTTGQVTFDTCGSDFDTMS